MLLGLLALGGALAPAPLALGPANFAGALAAQRFLLVLVHGNWCDFAKAHLLEFRALAAEAAQRRSKLALATVSLARPESFRAFLDVRANPTLALFADGRLAKAFTLGGEESVADVHAKAARMVALRLVEPLGALEQLAAAQGARIALVFAGGADAPLYADFLALVAAAKADDFGYFALAAAGALQPNALYLRRPAAELLLRVPPGLALAQTLQWLYHHARAPVLPFPQPALRHIRAHRNPALLLLFGSAAEAQSAAGQALLAAFDDAAEELRAAFKCTSCVLGAEGACREFVYAQLRLPPVERFPALRALAPVDDFRGEFLAFKGADGRLGDKAALLAFVEDFFASRLELDVQARRAEGAAAEWHLSATELFDALQDAPEKDVLVLFYRSTLGADRALLADYLHFAGRHRHWAGARLYAYDADFNRAFGFDDPARELPALMVAQRGFSRYRPKVFRALKGLEELLLLVCDQLSENKCAEIFAYTH